MSHLHEREKRAEELLQRHFDRTLTESEGRELLALWEAAPRLKDAARLNDYIETALTFFARLEDKPFSCEEDESMPILLEEENSLFGGDDVFKIDMPDLDELIHLAARSPSLPKTVSTEPSLPPSPAPLPYEPRAFRGLIPMKVLVPSILLLLGLAVFWEFHTSGVTDRVAPLDSFAARVVESVGATFDDNTFPLKKGMRLNAGLISLQSGLLELEYVNGIRVVLEGPTRYYIETPLEAACDSGRLSAFVPRAGRGFSVMTPKMTVRDLGTAFALDVDSDGTELHVVEGEVEANCMRKDWLTFKAGRGLSVRGAEQYRQIVADPTRFRPSDQVRLEAKKFQRSQREHWTRHAAAIASDPALLAHLDFESRVGNVFGPRPAEGRWPEKKGFEFQNKNDVIRLDVPGTTNALTLVASVRIDRMKDGTGIILTCRDFGPGSVQWQLARSGAMQLLVGSGSGGTPLCFESKPSIDSRQLGVWLQLAVTIDPDLRRICHYVDGRLVGETAFSESLSLRLGEIEIGNWIQTSVRLTDRHFQGCIDEIIFFNRALSSEELQKIVIY